MVGPCVSAFHYQFSIPGPLQNLIEQPLEKGDRKKLVHVPLMRIIPAQNVFFRLFKWFTSIPSHTTHCGLDCFNPHARIVVSKIDVQRWKAAHVDVEAEV